MERRTELNAADAEAITKFLEKVFAGGDPHRLALAATCELVKGGAPAHVLRGLGQLAAIVAIHKETENCTDERQLALLRAQIASVEWFKELQHYGFIVLAQPGSLGVEGKGKSPHWRLTELGMTSKASADSIFEAPTNDFLKWDRTRFKKQDPAPGAGSINRGQVPPATSRFRGLRSGWKSWAARGNQRMRSDTDAILLRSRRDLPCNSGPQKRN